MNSLKLYGMKYVYVEGETKERERSMSVQTHMHFSERGIIAFFRFSKESWTSKTGKAVLWLEALVGNILIYC